MISTVVALFCFSFYTVSGVVLDNETGKPVPDVHVFINDSTIGSVTDRDGRYELQSVPINAKEIAVSAIGYQNVIQSIPFSASGLIHIDFALVPSTVQLESVEVLALTEKSTREYINRFTSLLLGDGKKAKDCTLLNAEVLQFVVESESDNFSVFADEPLFIRNEALGYDLVYDLEEFFFVEGKDGLDEVMFNGARYFSDISTGSKRQARKWVRARKRVYEGSFRHFLSTLYKTTSVKELDKSGFEVLRKEGEQWHPFNDLDDFVGPKEAVHRALKGDHTLSIRAYSGDSKQNQWSALYFNNPSAAFDSTGLLLDPYEVTVEGFWATQRVATALPIDYRFGD